MLFSAMKCGCMFLLAAAYKPQLWSSDCKPAIDIYLEEMKQAAPEKRGDLSFKLALAYLKDQDQEKAMQEFLKAIKSIKTAPSPPVSTHEQELYDKGYSIYQTAQTGASPKEIALQLYQLLKQDTDTCHGHYLVNLLISTAYANLNRYEDFFKAFYMAYPYYSEHYLSYKTLAALHIRLFEKARLPEEREIQRAEVYKNAVVALDKNPEDIGLYKVAILFAEEKQRSQIIANLVEDIIKKNRMIPRHDILFFVHAAVDAGQKSQAQKFVDKSREWYHYSRSISEAQEYIDQ